MSHAPKGTDRLLMRPAVRHPGRRRRSRSDTSGPRHARDTRGQREFESTPPSPAPTSQAPRTAQTQRLTARVDLPGRAQLAPEQRIAGRPAAPCRAGCTIRNQVATKRSPDIANARVPAPPHQPQHAPASPPASPPRNSLVARSSRATPPPLAPPPWCRCQRTAGRGNPRRAPERFDRCQTRAEPGPTPAAAARPATRDAHAAPAADGCAAAVAAPRAAVPRAANR
jgi:hypothetical protein